MASDLQQILASIPIEQAKQWRYMIIHSDTLDTILDLFSEHGWIVTDGAADNPFGAKYTHIINDWYMLAAPSGEYFTHEYTLIVRDQIRPGIVCLVDGNTFAQKFRSPELFGRTDADQRLMCDLRGLWNEGENEYTPPTP